MDHSFKVHLLPSYVPMPASNVDKWAQGPLQLKHEALRRLSFTSDPNEPMISILLRLVTGYQFYYVGLLTLIRQLSANFTWYSKVLFLPASESLSIELAPVLARKHRWRVPYFPP